MANIDDLINRKIESNEIQNSNSQKMQEIIQEGYRVAELAQNADIVIKDLEKEFESQTKLSKKDIAFMFFATALQCCRQYFLTDFKTRLDDKEAADTTPGKKVFDPHNLEKRKDAGLEVRHHKLYNPTLEEIILHPVPFDTTKGGKNFKEQNPFPGTGKLAHSAATIGHDPILGWIFGTANIATSTLTGWNLQSFHVSSRLGKGGGDFLDKKANTAKVLSKTFDKLIKQGTKGKLIVATSLVKEGVHLASDINTANSLPFPIISVFDPEIASSLADYGIDMANILTIGKQAAVASAINMIIAMIHGMTFFQESGENKKLHEVRTHKIITYSNIIASASNIIAVAIASGIGLATNNSALVQKSIKKLDIGGLLVTLHRLINDYYFINQIKQEFILNNFDRMIQGNL